MRNPHLAEMLSKAGLVRGCSGLGGGQRRAPGAGRMQQSASTDYSTGNMPSAHDLNTESEVAKAAEEHNEEIEENQRQAFWRCEAAAAAVAVAVAAAIGIADGTGEADCGGRLLDRGRVSGGSGGSRFIPTRPDLGGGANRGSGNTPSEGGRGAMVSRRQVQRSASMSLCDSTSGHERLYCEGSPDGSGALGIFGLGGMGGIDAMSGGMMANKQQAANQYQQGAANQLGSQPSPTQQAYPFELPGEMNHPYFLQMQPWHT